MLSTKVSINEFRTNLSDIIGRVVYGKDRVVIKKYNREAAVLISLDEYERLTDPGRRFSKGEWDRRFEVFEQMKASQNGKTEEEIAKDIEKAVKMVRADKAKGR